MRFSVSYLVYSVKLPCCQAQLNLVNAPPYVGIYNVMHIENCDKIRGFFASCYHVAFHLCSLSTLATCGQILLHMQINFRLHA